MTPATSWRSGRDRMVDRDAPASFTTTLPLLLAAVLWMAAVQTAWAASPQPTPSAAVVRSVPPPQAPSHGASDATPASLPMGFTEDGHPYVGRPDAPVVIEEFSDYLCPFCGRHFQNTVPALLEKHVATGRVKLVYRDFPLASLHPTAARGSEAAHCVGEQGAERFWAMHDALFKTQRDWNRLPDPSDFLADAAARIGADVVRYRECMASGRKTSEVERSVAAGKALGFQGTPSFRLIDTVRGDAHTLVGALPLSVFEEWIAALESGEEPPTSKRAKSEPPKLPFWANTEGLAPDPDRPGITLAGDQFKGDPEAPIVVVEFSDFQCPACARHALETQPQLDESFVRPGQVRWVFKHLPLKEHANAPAAAAAAECAADQGAFWPMHDRLFQARDRWATADDEIDAALGSLAGDLDLDVDAFRACLDSRRPLQRVLRDVFDAQGVVRTTPTFIVLQGGKGYALRGARSAEQFAAHLRQRLEEALALEEASEQR